jgi:hypothetical protein
MEEHTLPFACTTNLLDRWIAPPNRTLTVTSDILPPETASATGALALTPAGQAALAGAPALAQGRPPAPVTLRAYKADWTHFADGRFAGIHRLRRRDDPARNRGNRHRPNGLVQWQPPVAILDVKDEGSHRAWEPARAGRSST